MFELNQKYEKHTPEMAIWCNEKGYYIVQEKDGYYIREHTKTLEELKQDRIKELKNNCKSYIFSIYPIDKQLNIINPLNDYTEEDKKNMNIFINKNRNICKEKEELIEKAKNKKELKEINIEF